MGSCVVLQQQPMQHTLSGVLHSDLTYPWQSAEVDLVS